MSEQIVAAPSVEHLFARDLRVGDVLLTPALEVYTGAPGGAFVEHTRVVAVEEAHLQGEDLGVGAKDEHEIPQLRVTTRRYGEGPPEREVEQDGAELGSERTVHLRYGEVVAVVRGDLIRLCTPRSST